MFNFVTLSLTLCLFKVTSASQISCSFDSDWCNFVPNEYFQRYTGPSPSLSSGPDEDRTGDGYYALCNGRLLLNPSEKCVLYQNVTLTQETGLKFWYYMYGLQLGTLELVLDENIVLWSMSGRQKNEWLHAEVKLPQGEHKIEFTGNRSSIGRSSCDIAIDDVFLEGQILTTQMVTVTRSTANLLQNISTNFDTLNNLDGWYTNYERNKWIQTDGILNVQLGKPGPVSDWSSITSGLKNITYPSYPSRSLCSIPYSVSVYPDKKEFYCTKVYSVTNKYFVCGLANFPEVSGNRQFGICTLGYYVMITSDKFDNEIGSIRSRLYSPVFKLDQNVNKFCFSFKYNILTSSNDGFRVYVENYLDQSEFKIVYSKRGPLREDRWYSVEVPVTDVNYDQIIMFFEPVRGNNRDFYASISIDSVNLEYKDCDPIPEEIITTEVESLTTVDPSIETTQSFSTNFHYSMEESTFLHTQEGSSTSFETSLVDDRTTNEEETSLETKTSLITSVETLETEESTKYVTAIPSQESTSSMSTSLYTSNPVTSISQSTELSSNGQTKSSSISSLETTTSTISSVGSTVETVSLSSSTSTSTSSSTTSSQKTSKSPLDTDKNDNRNIYLGIFIPLGIVLVLSSILIGKKYFFKFISSRFKYMSDDKLEMF